MNRALRSFVLAAACAALAWGLSRTNTDSTVPSADATPATQTERASPPSANSTTRNVGFRTRDRLRDHYAKHGREFGAISEAEYLQRAQQLRDAPIGASVLEIVRSTDGVISRFDTRSGDFGAYDADGTIRTFFRPNDGEAYFRRQARRAPRD